MNEDFMTDRQQLPLILNGFAMDYRQEPIERPNGLPLNIWLQIVHGSGEVIIEGKKIVAQAGMAVFLKANSQYAYHALCENWITHFITFSGSVCDQILSALHINQSGVYHVADPENLSKHFHRIARIRSFSTSLQNRALSKALYSMLLDLSRNVQYITADMPAVQNESLQLVIQFIEEHYTEPLGLDDLAILVNLRKEYLCALFKKHMGQTIFHFLQSIRIAHARIYLKQYPEKTVQEISLLCGFESSSYFCRVFRQIEGTSPQRYRQGAT
jgi:YesN/AraC family two-component response regulator